MQAEKKQAWQWQTLTLSQYVEFRNGVPLGDSKSFSNMLNRSLGAASFAEFWQYWNPIWGYGLGKYVYAPLQQILPPMAVRHSFAFLFTTWFFLLGVGAVLGRALGMALSNHPWWIRASVNLVYLVSSFPGTNAFSSFIPIHTIWRIQKSPS